MIQDQSPLAHAITPILYYSILCLSSIYRLQHMNTGSVSEGFLQANDHPFYSRNRSGAFGNSQTGEEVFHPRPIGDLHLKPAVRIVCCPLAAKGAEQSDLNLHG